MLPCELPYLLSVSLESRDFHGATEYLLPFHIRDIRMQKQGRTFLSVCGGIVQGIVEGLFKARLDSSAVQNVLTLSGFVPVSFYGISTFFPLKPPLPALLSGMKVKYFSADLAGLRNKLKHTGCLEALFYQLLAKIY